MSLVIENQGCGFIGDLGTGWRISQNGSPIILGDNSGRLGGLTFSAACDGTSKFTIDNYLSVKHYFDNRVDRWLSSFDGYVRGVDTNGKTGQFTMSSLLASLDVERTSSVDSGGTYQRSFSIPAGEEYEITSTTYTVGGYWTSVGSENVFVPRPNIIWDITSSDDFVYVLAAGQHLGEVVLQYGIDGVFYQLWPVYSDATDIASPDSRYISYADGYLYIAQVNADRVKKFDTNGVFILQWGSAGTGDGQFSTISGIAANGYGLNAVYTVDSVQGRVTCFTETGTYLFKWGTLGTGAGSTVFNSPNSISIDPVTDNVFVGDQHARVRAYTSGGGYVSEPVGRYSFTTNKSEGDFVTGAYPIRTAFDHLGNCYALQLGHLYKFIREAGVTDWSIIRGESIRHYDVGSTDIDPPDALTITHDTGIIHVAQANDTVMQYAGSLGAIRSYLLYYVALAVPDFPVRMLLLNEEWAIGEAAYISWTGNVWNQLCQLVAATGNAMAVFDDKLLFFNRASRWFPLPQDVTIQPVTFNSRAAGQAIEIVNQNSRYTVMHEVLYSAAADNQRTFSAGIGTLTYLTVDQQSYPEFLDQPEADVVVSDGKYVVVDENGLVVDPTLWKDYGGAVRAEIGERPGTIELTIFGPGRAIPGYDPPYKIAQTAGTPSLTITGAGVVADPEVLTIGTGVPESVTSRKVGQSINSPFAFNAHTAYGEGSWAAYNSGTPSQRVAFTFRVNNTNNWTDTNVSVGGTFQFVGMQIRHDDAVYIVEDLDYNATEITITCYRYTRTGWGTGETGIGISPLPEEIWAGKTANEFDAFWSGFTAQDYTIAPLHNPYGV